MPPPASGHTGISMFSRLPLPSEEAAPAFRAQITSLPSLEPRGFSRPSPPQPAGLPFSTSLPSVPPAPVATRATFLFFLFQT